MTEQKIKYDKESFQIISLFENITKTKVNDAIITDTEIIFILPRTRIKQALGKNSSNINKLKDKTNKKIKLVEESKDVKGFINSFIRPLKVDSITEEDNIITLHSQDTKTKGLLIGRNAQNLRKLERIAKRYFPKIEEIKVTD